MTAVGGAGLWRRDLELPFQKVAEETIVVVPRRREVHLLNETAARLWELLETPRSLAELVAALREEYDADSAELSEAITECVHELAQKGLFAAVLGGAR